MSDTGPISETVALRWRPGAPFLVLEGVEAMWRGHRVRHRPGGYTDGLSSPQFTHALPDAEPFGWATVPAVLHDAGYHDDLEAFHAYPEGGLLAGAWRKFTLSKSDCDQMFLELLQSIATTTQHQLEADMFWLAVSRGGQPAFDAGRAR